MVPTGGPELYCLSNECKINGAACIIDDNIQKMIAEKVGGDYFVLPSSVHEVLIMPKSEDMDPKELRNMVQNVNVTQRKGRSFRIRCMIMMPRHTSWAFVFRERN